MRADECGAAGEKDFHEIFGLMGNDK